MAGSKIKRILTIAFAALSLFQFVGTAEAQQRGKIRQRYTAVDRNEENGFGFILTDIVYKPDDNLVRLCGIIEGTPSTSDRIDGVTLFCAGKKIEASDIDGVDFNRYFIWEDNGSISLEIDFPDYKLSKEMLTGRRECRVIFHTVKGDIAIPIANAKHKNRKK